MKKIAMISAVTLLLFLLEFLCANIFGPWFHPNFLILLLIFIDLHWGVRYGLFVAVLAGFLKDSFAVGVFGIHIVSFIGCVYTTTLLRRYLFYDVDFGFLRILMAFLMTVLNFLFTYGLKSLFQAVDFFEMASFVALPEVLATTVAAGFVFKKLKLCVLKLSV